MIFRLRTIDHTGDGREIVRERDLDQPGLTIGRDAANDIHLPDLAVEAQHARISLGSEGRIKVEATGTLGFTRDGASSTSATIDPASGGELRFGSYRIALSQADDGAVLLTIRKVDDAAEEAPFDEKRSFSLIGSMPGKRVMAWVLGIAVLLAFLAVPVVSSLTRAPKSTVSGDAAWSSGPLSLAHHGLEGKCEACHVKPFEAVQDQSCKACHATVHDHADAARMLGARGDAPLGRKFLQTVAHQFGRPGPGSCVSCHTEHEGAGRMEPTHQQFCADCHGTLAARLSDTKLGNAGDFGTLHPQFRPQVALTAGSPALTRVSLDQHPREASGLTFPHRLHLDSLGGAAKMAMRLGSGAGYGSALQCANCHRKSEDGVRFQPVNMERDCESCHSLAYDRVGSTVRTLKHGDVAQMKADLLAADHGASPVRTTMISGRQRPGGFATSGPYYANFSRPSGGEGMIRQALSRDGVCGECHTPVIGAGGMTVLPVTQVSRFMLNGWFDHKAHSTEKCISCHAAPTSQTSADLLLPDVKQCRSCHLGEDSSAAKVPSSCAMCHAYHPAPTAPPSARRE